MGAPYHYGPNVKGSVKVTLTAAQIAHLFPGARFEVELEGSGKTCEDIECEDFQILECSDVVNVRQDEGGVKWSELTELLHDNADGYIDFDLEY